MNVNENMLVLIFLLWIFTACQWCNYEHEYNNEEKQWVVGKVNPNYSKSEEPTDT